MNLQLYRLPWGGGGFRTTIEEDLNNKTVILGQQQNIPYSVSIVTQAWNQWSGQSLSTIDPTHFYVRFLPNNLEELRTLLNFEESDDLDFELYPLDYELVQEGDYYHDPLLPAEQITWHYTVVPVGFSFPNIQYEILEELVLTPYMSDLTELAYSIASVEYDNTWKTGEGGEDPETPCNPSCGNYPCCLLEEFPCDDQDPCLDPPCVPGSPTWPECLEPPNNDNDEPSGNLNECGCPIPFESRFPAGCVQVEDTQLDPEPGVRGVKVVVKNTPFSHRSTFTDENGCWRINKRHRGKVRVKVKFKNDKCKIRAIRSWGASLWQYSKVLTDKKIYYGPSYNNIYRLYEQNSDINSKRRAFWYAATGNNALFEFIDFATADGISTPPTVLDILLTPGSEGEAAPMLGKISSNPWVVLSINLFITVLISPSLGGPLLSALIGYLAIFAPDVVYNHGGADIGEASDATKETWYHEFAHAAHYNALNDDGYWIGNIKYILDNGGYGDGTANNAGRCAVIEMWGFHYGPVCADRQYGLYHSNTTSTIPTVQERTRHIYLLESFVPTLPPNTANTWIPQGVFWTALTTML